MHQNWRNDQHKVSNENIRGDNCYWLEFIYDLHNEVMLGRKELRRLNKINGNSIKKSYKYKWGLQHVFLQQLQCQHAVILYFSPKPLGGQFSHQQVIQSANVLAETYLMSLSPYFALNFK